LKKYLIWYEQTDKVIHGQLITDVVVGFLSWWKGKPLCIPYLLNIIH